MVREVIEIALNLYMRWDVRSIGFGGELVADARACPVDVCALDVLARQVRKSGSLLYVGRRLLLVEVTGGCPVAKLNESIVLI